MTGSTTQTAVQPGTSGAAGALHSASAADTFGDMLRSLSRPCTTVVPQAVEKAAANPTREIQAAEIAGEPSAEQDEAASDSEAQTPADLPQMSAAAAGVAGQNLSPGLPAKEGVLEQTNLPAIHVDKTAVGKHADVRPEKGSRAREAVADTRADDQTPSPAVLAQASDTTLAFAAYAVAQLQSTAPHAVASTGAASTQDAVTRSGAAQRPEKSVKPAADPLVRTNAIESEEGQTAAATDAGIAVPVEDASAAFALEEKGNDLTARVDGSAMKASVVTGSTIPRARTAEPQTAISRPSDKSEADGVRRAPSSAATVLSGAGKTAGSRSANRSSAQDGSTPAAQASANPLAASAPAATPAVTRNEIAGRSETATPDMKLGGTVARDGATATLEEVRTVESHRTAAPQVEIGIQDASLGEVRVQAAIDRSGVMHIDVAGRSQATDAMLDQIAPLMHAAIAQQAEAHGQGNGVHVTVAASLAENGRGGVGSMTGSGMGGVAQSGAFSSSLSNDAQQQPQQQQRRPQMVAYGSSALRTEVRDDLMRATFAAPSFSPQSKGLSGLSVRI